MGGCGGGGSASVPSLSSNTPAIAVSATTGGITPALTSPITFTTPTGQFYYELSDVGTTGLTFGVRTTGANGKILSNYPSIDGVTSIDNFTGNSTLVSTAVLAYPIGQTFYGSWSGTLSIHGITFANPSLLGAGVYQDAITLKVCSDAACTQQISGSPLTIPVTYTVTGAPTPITQVTLSPNDLIEAPGSQATSPTGSITINAAGAPLTGVYVSEGASAAGLVTQATLSSNVADGPTGEVIFSLKPPVAVGAGFHFDTFPINVCYDVACTKPLQGNPWTANVTYIIDPVAGQDYTEQSIGIDVGGLAWDSATARLYAIIPGYSPLDPNTLASIDPSTATIENAVTLDGGAGQIEPGTLSVSDDGQYLFVAIADGLAEHVDRLRASDLSLDLSFSVQGYEIETLQPAPGEPHSLAILTNGPASKLVIYDDAVPRTDALTTDSSGTIGSFTWGSDASTLYASVWEAGIGGAVDVLTATPSGLQIAQSIGNLPTATPAFAGMHLVNGILYFESGVTVDPSTSAVSTPFTSDPSTVPSAAFDGGLNRAFFVNTDQPIGSTTSMTTIETYNLSGGQPLWLVRFPAQNPATQLTRWGSNGLAFFDNAGGTQSLMLISGPLITQ
jgi:hypothetical protein